MKPRIRKPLPKPAYTIAATGLHGGGAAGFHISNAKGTAYAEGHVGLPEQILPIVEAEGYGSEEELVEAIASHGSDVIAWLSWIRVDEASRGRGVGSRLLDFTIDRLRDIGAVAVFGFTVPADDEDDPFRLQSWYFRHGFEPIGDHPDRENISIVRSL